MDTNAKPSFFIRMLRPIARGWLRTTGWRIVGDMPDVPKFIIVAAPHTTNWDLPYTLAAGVHYGLAVNWMGKDSLFRWPIGGLMRALGGIAVDRSRQSNAVAAMAETFARHDRLALVIAPQGTRKAVSRWKSGFYHIAVEARVPLALAFIDYKRKMLGVAEVFHPTGDYEADLPRILAIYDQATSGLVQAKAFAAEPA